MVVPVGFFSPVLVQASEECPSVFSFKSKGFEKCFRSFYVETFFKFFDGDGAAAILLGKKKNIKKTGEPLFSA